jgi:pyridoxine 4-dehydrogenase
VEDLSLSTGFTQLGNHMTALDAAKSGSFKIGNEFDVNRLSFGAMRITGGGIWGEPKDRTEAIRTLKRLPEIAVNFIDTADSYGPDVSEKLIHMALHPYKDLLVATKGGLERPGPNNWVPSGRPEYLVADVAAADIVLSNDEFAALHEAGKRHASR